MRGALEYLNEKSLIYRSYGHIFNGDYELGYKDLLEAQAINELDFASQYNLVISKAILKMYQGNYEVGFDLCE